MTPDTAIRRQARDASPEWFPALGRRSSPISISPAPPPLFVLHGNTVRSVSAAADEPPRYGMLADFLAEQVFGRWALVLHYDLARGLRAFAGRDGKRLKEMVVRANKKVGDLSALRARIQPPRSRCSTASCRTTSWPPRKSA